jgi:hypothetical protein
MKRLMIASSVAELGGHQPKKLGEMRMTICQDGNMMSFEAETVPILPPILHQVNMPAQVSQANDNCTFDNDQQEAMSRLKGCEVIHIILSETR